MSVTGVRASQASTSTSSSVNASRASLGAADDVVKLPRGNLVRTYASSGSQLAAMDVRFSESQAKTAATILVGAGDKRAFGSQAEVIYAARDYGFRPFSGVEVFDSKKHFMMNDEPVQMVRPVGAGPAISRTGGGACGGF